MEAADGLFYDYTATRGDARQSRRKDGEAP